MSDQLTLDLDQTEDAARDFREWLLSLPETPWAADEEDTHHAA